MVLLLLAVEAVRGILVVGGLGQGNNGRTGEGDTLVSRAKDDVVLDTGIVDGSSVELADLGERGTGVEEAGVEEVGGDTAGLEGELSKLQDLVLDSKLDKLALIILDAHIGCSVTVVGRRVRRRLLSVSKDLLLMSEG